MNLENNFNPKGGQDESLFNGNNIVKRNIGEELVILIVDDQKIYQEILKYKLGSICDKGGKIFGKKVSIVTADSAQEAFRILQEDEAINMVISDVWMGSDDQAGITLLGAVKDKVASLLVSASDYREVAEKEGIPFIEKQVSSDLLKKFIEESVKKME